MLTPAERELGFLLLKGLSVKEESAVLGKSERTVRQQSLVIYRKGGIERELVVRTRRSFPCQSDDGARDRRAEHREPEPERHALHHLAPAEFTGIAHAPSVQTFSRGAQTEAGASPTRRNR